MECIYVCIDILRCARHDSTNIRLVNQLAMQLDVRRHNNRARKKNKMRLRERDVYLKEDNSKKLARNYSFLIKNELGDLFPPPQRTISARI